MGRRISRQYRRCVNSFTRFPWARYCCGFFEVPFAACRPPPR
jgi:hypothetical protein